ncbi:sugar transferase [Amaricoccus sp.]|uniref:sugar transferase n=1 Tax=Amaricoccus sp. TaxID=1872485 RepID=UPI001B64979F|nr:sugar transferase [Amaricoccus sp.]MBP7003134.1 sugar transferase [Amaricoccus sp.]
MSHISEMDVEAVVPVSSGHAADGLYNRLFKRWFDLALILLSAPFVLPMVLMLGLVVRRDGGPAFYVQDRIGLDGRAFRLWKLRTMVTDADARLAADLAANPALRAEWDETQKLKADPRITPIGRLLRKASLDELPQLWNVFRGDMSLVGPRPMLPEQRALYPGRDYYAMRPGLTGPWQVSERNETSFAGRAEFDSAYARRVSLPTDIAIMCMTVWVVLRGTGY